MNFLILYLLKIANSVNNEVTDLQNCPGLEFQVPIIMLQDHLEMEEFKSLVILLRFTYN